MRQVLDFSEMDIEHAEGKRQESLFNRCKEHLYVKQELVFQTGPPILTVGTQAAPDTSQNQERTPTLPCYNEDAARDHSDQSVKEATPGREAFHGHQNGVADVQGDDSHVALLQDIELHNDQRRTSINYDMNLTQDMQKTLKYQNDMHL